MPSITSFARGVAAAFDARAALDVLLLAVLIYFGLLGLQQARTGYAMRGALLLAALYLLARQLNLALTSGAIEAFLAVLLVASIMIYREELRRMVERLAMLARGRRAGTTQSRTLAEELSQTAFDLAAIQCGALIVISGDDPTDPHVTKGIPLSAHPSDPLLKSIFDASSPGHDGALIIKDGIATRFSVHLPLSHNDAELGFLGTRHAAALGLAERTDALCIVVSEERGSVSLAQAGKLRPVASAAELEQAITDHLGQERRPAPAAARALLVGHNAEKLGAVLLALLAWLVLVYGGEPMTESIDAVVQVRDAGGQDAEVVPQLLKVRASGTRRDFALASTSAARVVVSVRGLGPGHHQLAVSPEDVTLPRGLTFKSATPAVVRVLIRPPPP